LHATKLKSENCVVGGCDGVEKISDGHNNVVDAPVELTISQILSFAYK